MADKVASSQPMRADKWYIRMALNRFRASTEVALESAGGGIGGCRENRTQWADMVWQIVDGLPDLTPDVVLTDTSAGALQTAINGLVSGQVLEVQTDATYDPVVIPGGVPMTIVAADGSAPKISGTEALVLSNGVSDFVMSGFSFPNCASPAANERGACVSLAHYGIVNRVLFNACVFEDVSSGSAVMMSYHQSTGGDNYATANLPSEMSHMVGFVGCSFLRAAQADYIEGASLALRGCDDVYVGGTTVNGDGTHDSRGIQFQNCTSVFCAQCAVSNYPTADATGGEGYKLDRIGSPTYRTTAFLLDCTVENCAEGFDVDDYTYAYLARCAATGCSKGFGLDDTGFATFDCCEAADCVTGAGQGFVVEAGGVASLVSPYAHGCTVNYSIGAAFDPDTAPEGSYPLSRATDQEYVAATPASWASPAPTTAKQAIDRIAAAVAGLLGGPIP